MNKAQSYIEHFYSKYKGRVPFRAGCAGGFSFVYPFVYEDESGNSIGLVSMAWEKETNENLVRIFHLSSFKNRLGKGSLILSNLCRIADEFEVDLTLQAEPQSNGQELIGQSELISWYRRFGFSGNCIMVRHANT